ncbi:MAG: ABC transporter ATP-binding protein [Thermomicrobiales bacterium]
MPTPALTLRTRNLGKRYSASTTGPDSGWALRRITLDLPAGSLIALLGPNGAGKSTFIHLLCGAIAPTEGAVGALPSHVRLGWCSQQQAIDWYLDVWDNVIMGARLAGIGRAESHRLTTRALETVHLTDKARAQTDSLSGGQLQRVQIARALVANPEVLILDEPTVGLDVESAESLLIDLRRRADAGALVIVSSHDLGLLERWCDQILLLANGQVVAFEPRDPFMERFAGAETLEITLAQDGPLAATGIARLRDAAITIVPPTPEIRSDVLTLQVPRGMPLGAVLAMIEPDATVVDVQRRTPGLREAYLALARTSSPSSASPSNDATPT